MTDEKDKETTTNDELTEKQRKAMDLLYDAMIFWHGEGLKLIKRLENNLNASGEGRMAANIAKIWKDVDDRWIDIASKIMPYQSAKLSNIQIKSTNIHKFVIEAPRVIKDKREWLDLVEQEQKALPKPIPIGQIMNGHDQTIDELEYDEING